MSFLKFLGIAAATYIGFFFIILLFCFLFWDWIIIYNIFTFASEKGAFAHRLILLISFIAGLKSVDNF
jgi:hypothetical protein